MDLTSLGELDVLDEVVIGDVYDLAKIAPAPDMVLDCGANIGYFSSLCRIHFPHARIFCWEPEPLNFARLMSQPLMDSQLVTCFPTAVGLHEGTEPWTGDGTGGRLLEKDDLPGATATVNSIDFRNWLLTHASGHVLVKMDIEGYENKLLPSLNGAWPACCTLLLETHAHEGRDEDITASLHSEGFVLRLTRSHSLPEDPRIFKEYIGLRR